MNITKLPVRNRRFWVVQALVLLVVLVHAWGDIARDRGLTPIPGEVWMLLLFIPVLYGGMNFGQAGALGAVISGTAILVPEALLTDHTGAELWMVWGILGTVTVSAILLGKGYDEAIARARQAAEIEALRDSEERFRLIFDAAPTGMALVDLDLNFIRVNAALCAMVGRTESEVLGLGVRGLTVPEDQDVTDIALRTELDLTQITKRYRHRNGHEVWVQITSNVFHGTDGTPRYFISQFQDVTEARRSADELTFRAHHDSLTGLANRALFEDRLAHAIARTERSSSGFNAVLMIDLDDFKKVNDTLGHHAGDQLLVQVSLRLTAVTRVTDTLCRYGGDEFIYLVEEASSVDAVDQATMRLLQQFDTPFLLAHGEVTQRASVGVAIGGPGGMSGDELIRCADLALYDAKRHTKGGRVVFAGARPGAVEVVTTPP